MGQEYALKLRRSRNQHRTHALTPTRLRFFPGPIDCQEALKKMMLSPEYLRRQADNCLRIARACFDLASAERLRLMAAELNAKAAELEDFDRQDRPMQHGFARNTTSS